MRPPLPGLGDLRRGRRASGLFRLVLFLSLLAVALFRGGRALAFAKEGDFGGILAAAALLGAMLLLLVAEGREKGRRSRSSAFAARFHRNRLAGAGLAAMILLYLAALLTPLLAPADPNRQNLDSGMFRAPSAQNPLGTDRFGRDVLSRILYGSRISLTIGFVAVAVGVGIGALVGATAGYYRGIPDRILMRLVDMLLSFPRLILLLAVIAIFRPSVFLLVAVLGLTGWMGTARLVRGEVLSLREREFVTAARALGYGAPRIIFRHILPNVVAPIIVAATLGIGNTVMLEASLSFLGLGVQPPTASWGTMISDGRDTLTQAWWIATFPGLAILFTVVSFNLVGDGLRDAFDPRRR
ncbi:MAG: ABC transporter permease [Candidatus Eisenbacteria bacterium]